MAHVCDVCHKGELSGNNVSQLFLPTAKDWKTNLFVVTSKRDYSLELNVLDISYILRYNQRRRRI